CARLHLRGRHGERLLFLNWTDLNVGGPQTARRILLPASRGRCLLRNRYTRAIIGRRELGLERRVSPLTPRWRRRRRWRLVSRRPCGCAVGRRSAPPEADFSAHRAASLFPSM